MLSRVVFCLREEGGNRFTLGHVESEVLLRYAECRVRQMGIEAWRSGLYVEICESIIQ